jgi:hypothetical protein
MAGSFHDTRRRSLTRYSWGPLASFRLSIESKQNEARALCSIALVLISEDAIWYALERNDTNALFTLGCRVASELKHNGIIRS